MTNGEKPIYITRQQFYSELGNIWLYITIVIGVILYAKLRGMLWGCLGASISMTVRFAWQAYRAKRAKEAPAKSL